MLTRRMFFHTKWHKYVKMMVNKMIFTKMKEVVNTEERLSKFTINEMGYGNPRTPHVSSTKEDRMIHSSKFWEIRTAPPTIEILPQSIRNTQIT